MANAVDRLRMPIDRALDDKWEQGRKKHRPEGGALFVGQHPVIELHEEALDAYLYAWAIPPKDVPEDVIRELQKTALNLLHGARAAAKTAGIL